MAVMFNLDEFDDSRRNFEAFFFSHITIIEGHMLTLRTAIEQSPCEANFEEFIMVKIWNFVNLLAQNSGHSYENKV